jgi:hypothetical protein
MSSATWRCGGSSGDGAPSNTFKAMDAMDGYRSAAIQTLAKSSEMLHALLEKSKPHLERAAAGPAAARVDPGLVGPVAL